MLIFIPPLTINFFLSINCQFSSRKLNTVDTQSVVLRINLFQGCKTFHKLFNKHFIKFIAFNKYIDDHNDN